MNPQHSLGDDMPKHWSDAKPFLVSLAVACWLAAISYLFAHARGWVP